SRAVDGLQRRPVERRQTSLHQTGGDGQTLRFGSRRRSLLAGCESLRRLWLCERLSGRENLPRLEDRPDLRRHGQYAESDHRQDAAGRIAETEGRRERGKERLKDRKTRR